MTSNLCNSCTNIGCEFQSGIIRTECAFYMPPHIEPDNSGNYVVMQPIAEAISKDQYEARLKADEAIKYFKRHLDLYCVDGISREAEEMAIKALEQESKTDVGKLLDKTFDDFCKCEGGEGWLKIDGKEYSTDVGYALEGMRIFTEVFKRRLAESEVDT